MVDFQNDDLLGGMVAPFETVSVIVKSGAGVKLTRGSVLGVVGQEADGTYIVALVDSTKTDGSEKPFGVLADVEVDATTENKRATAYVTGEFNRAALKFGGTDTVTKHEQALRNIGIITKRVVK